MKALIIRNDRIGDMVLTLPAIIVLKKRFKDSLITVLASKTNFEVLKLLPFEVKILIDNGFFKNVKELRNRNFDIGIDFVMNWRGLNPLLLYSGNVRKKIGFYYPFREIFYDITVRQDNRLSLLRQNFLLLKKLGIDEEIGFPIENLNIKKSDKNIDIVFHPGGYYPSQRWPLEYFIELMKRIKEHGFRFAIIGVRMEKNILEKIRDEFPDEEYLIDASLMEIASVMKKAKLFIGNNSGPLHLASLIGISTISFLGPTNPFLFWPQGKKDFVFKKELSCIGCGKGYCKKHTCIKKIRVEEVFDKIFDILK